MIEPGAELLHYRLVKRIGAGGMGVVWRATDTTLGRDVAIKILPAEFAGSPDRMARFEREARLLASLNHPNVAAVYGLHEAGGVRFLAMELVQGTTLREEIARGIPPQRVIELAAAIADGLAAAHRHHVIHRDLKPDNIMIDAEGRPKLLDFGLAKLASRVTVNVDDATALRDGVTTLVPQAGPATAEGAIVGSIPYMSPEQAQGLPVDARTDIFSLGIVLYEMTTGKRPFTGDTLLSVLTSILRDAPAPITSLAPMAPALLNGVISRCLEKRPEDRYDDASALRDELAALRVDSSSGSRPRPVAMRSVNMKRIAALTAAVVVMATAGTWMYKRHKEQKWLRMEALPRLQSFVDHIQTLDEGRESWDAWMMARQIEAFAPHEPLVAKLRTRFTRETTIRSEPSGAMVFARFYDEPEAQPVFIGKTPLLKIAYPRGLTRVRLELPGKVPAEDLVWNSVLSGGVDFDYQLRDPGAVPAGMVPVPEGAPNVVMPGLEHLAPERIASFFIDRHEVTNREYKRFVVGGGYRETKNWTQPFVDGGRTLTFEAAVARFTDTTGRTGPATWESGTYATGQDDYPVAGVSWYEAAAYATWSGKRLPTVYHWNRVAYTVASARVIPMSNLNRKGLVPAGSTSALNRFGVSDLAGNVREWVFNSVAQGRSHLILGGAWNDPEYAFADAYAQPSFDRSRTNGFRCIRLAGEEPNATALQKPLEPAYRDFYAEKPVSDEIFAQYLHLFAYDKTHLDALVDETRREPDYVRERVTFNAAYGSERMSAYLFLPTSGKPPYQVIINFPGSSAISQHSSKTIDPGRIDFLLKSGRAVVWPIFKGTYERGDGLRSDTPNETTFFKDHVVMWGKDLSRTIDYLATRNDIDSSRIAYYGFSWGGAMGAIMPAVEKRIRANVLYVAGFTFQKALPEADQINYITRVRQPTLMLNGELDFYFPKETAQKPFYDLLGTPAAHKKRLLFPGGHSVPREDMIRESLDWLDRYLGPVR